LLLPKITFRLVEGDSVEKEKKKKEEKGEGGRRGPHR